VFHSIDTSGVTSYGALGHALTWTSNIFSSLWSKSDSQLYPSIV